MICEVCGEECTTRSACLVTGVETRGKTEMCFDWENRVVYLHEGELLNNE